MTRPLSPLNALVAAVAGLGFALGAAAQTGTTAVQGAPAARSAKSELPRSEHSFIEKAAMGGLVEVELGQLAQQKAASEQVKQFGARMVADHGKANGELKQIASAKGVTLPAQLDKKHRKDVDRLQKASGAEFDREYMRHMVSDHKEDVSDFRKEAKSGKDADVKAFADKTLPTLEEHLKMAQSTYDAVKGSKSASK